MYNVITKVITSRIKPFLDKLITPFQCSFILGCHNLDNIIIVQEVIHSMEKKKGKKGFMEIKVDLEKSI